MAAGASALVFLSPMRYFLCMSPENTQVTEPTTPAEASAEPLAAAIGDVLTCILDSSLRNSVANAEKVSSHPSVVDAMTAAAAGDCDGFYFAVQYPVAQVIQGLARKAIQNNENGQFLLTHSQFVERQFRAVIDKYEGSACCADKSGFLVDSLLEFFKLGTEVTINRDQQYTYHLPTKVFQTHHETINFFFCVQSFYYGHTGPLCDTLAAIDLQQSGTAPVADRLRASLSAVLASYVGRDTLGKLAEGQGTGTDDGKAWLAAAALLLASARSPTGTTK